MRLRKRIAKLVGQARSELEAGSRSNALELMKEAVRFDENRGMVIQAILTFEREGSTSSDDRNDSPPGNAETAGERIGSSMASSDRLNELFVSSDRAYEQGDQAGAMNFLKEARILAPDNRDVAMRFALLKRRIKSVNLVRIARREMENERYDKAVVCARQAFDLLPGAEGLAELLADLESVEGSVPVSGDQSPAADSDAPPYILQIRALVQENKLERAAELARGTLTDHPDNELLLRFVDKFTKLGLL